MHSSLTLNHWEENRLKVREGEKIEVITQPRAFVGSSMKPHQSIGELQVREVDQAH